MINWNFGFFDIANTLVNVIYFAVVVGTMIVVLLDNRNPLKTIAWLLVLIFLPFVGIIIYFFFGQDQRRERIISKKSFGSLLKKPRAQYLAQDNIEIPHSYSTVIQLFQQINEAFPYEKNHIDFYVNGYEKFIALIKEFYKAKDHIHINYYIFEDDALGALIKDVLIDRAKAGVTVRVIYDDVGCWSVSSNFFDEMRCAGIEVRAYLKVRFPLFTSKVNYRNHRKIIVIDGTVGFVGGMNIANRYVKGVGYGHWRDTHIKIRGKAVHGLQTAFLVDWYFVDHSLLSSDRFFPVINPQGDALCQIVTSEPIGQWREIMQGLILSIGQARSYFYIQTPYFLPTEPVQLALKTAALSGVDVRIMIPKKGDSKIAYFASQSYIEEMLSAGVKFYLYETGFLHAKTMVSDDLLSSVGTTNIDFRSFEHNFEINAFIYDAKTAKEMKEIFLQDQHHCEEIFYKNWVKRPIRMRILESIVRILSPLL